MSDIRPFLAFATNPPRAFADALSSVDVPVQPSPWSPKPDRETPAIDLDAVRAEAVAAGRAEGLAETAALRKQLQTLIANFKTPPASAIAEMVGDAACAVIETWIESSDPRALLAPVLREWSAAETTVRVHPDDVAALGEVAMTVVPDETMPRGDIVLRSATAELEHRWADRLAELRAAIANGIEAAK